MDYKQIAKVIQDTDYIYYGIRHCTEDEKYKVGDVCRNSYDWDYEYDISTFDTDEPIELDGTCAIDIRIYNSDGTEEDIIERVKRALEKSNVYRANAGDTVLIASDDMDYDMNNDEIIMKNAIVLAIL